MRSGGVDRPLALQQYLLHLTGPCAPHLLVDEDQLAQVMRVAQSMGTVILPIRTEAIVDGPSLERWQDTDLARRLGATLFMIGVVRQLRGAGRVQPPALVSDIHPRLVEVGDIRSDQALLDVGFGLQQGGGTPRDAACKVPSETGWPNRSSQSDNSVRTGPEVLLVEREQQALDPSAIAGPRGKPVRESPNIVLATTRTRFDDDAMLGDDQ